MAEQPGEAQGQSPPPSFSVPLPVLAGAVVTALCLGILIGTKLRRPVVAEAPPIPPGYQVRTVSPPPPVPAARPAPPIVDVPQVNGAGGGGAKVFSPIATAGSEAEWIPADDPPG